MSAKIIVLYIASNFHKMACSIIVKKLIMFFKEIAYSRLLILLNIKC